MLLQEYAWRGCIELHHKNAMKTVPRFNPGLVMILPAASMRKPQ